MARNLAALGVRAIAASAAATIGALAPPALAHHSYAGFDRERPPRSAG
jgi:hypothetical protein